MHTFEITIANNSESWVQMMQFEDMMTALSYTKGCADGWWADHWYQVHCRETNEHADGPYPGGKAMRWVGNPLHQCMVEVE